jgi:hypothetical protein
LRKIKTGQNANDPKIEILPGKPQKISGELVLEVDLVDLK